jgi:hypothetical protein
MKAGRYHEARSVSSLFVVLRDRGLLGRAACFGSVLVTIAHGCGCISGGGPGKMNRASYWNSLPTSVISILTGQRWWDDYAEGRVYLSPERQRLTLGVACARIRRMSFLERSTHECGMLPENLFTA